MSFFHYLTDGLYNGSQYYTYNNPNVVGNVMFVP